MTPEEIRLAGAQGGDSSVISARQERESRIAADIASMAAGHNPGHAEQITFHQGAPSVQEQMVTKTPAPHTPDVGGHQSAGDRVG